MKTATVSIKGMSPILLHNPVTMAGKPVAGKKRIPTPEEEAASSRYLMPGTETLAFPIINIVQSIVNASSGIKIGKQSIVPFIAGCVVPAEEFASFKTQEYVIDTRRAVVQRQGVMRSRARLNSWNLTFDLQLDSDNMPDGVIESLGSIITEAGRRIGIGDYRPQKKGPFGRFELVSLKIK
jgi:hypothetical protein